MKNSLSILMIIAISFLFACTNQNPQAENLPQVSTGIASTGPDAIIYQTKNDYALMVPVIMNDIKTDIVSFPAPGDLLYKGKPALPDVLTNGFLLDNRGINKNVAFLNITYDDYMMLKETPAKDELMEMILDKDPLLKMYNCGKRALFNNEVEELNAYILENDFSKFTKLK